MEYKYKNGDKVTLKPSGIEKLRGNCASYSPSDDTRQEDYLLIRGKHDYSGGHYYSWEAYNKNDERFDSCSDHDIDDNDLVDYQDKNNAQTGTINKIMNKITTFVKNLTLSPDEKLMRKHGLKDECGNVTEDGKAAILANLYNSTENQTYLLSIATGLEAEETATK